MPNELEIYRRLTYIFADIFGRDVQLRPCVSAKDVEGWDSLKQIEIILAAEEEFRIRLSTREVDSLRNVGDLVRVLTSKC